MAKIFEHFLATDTGTAEKARTPAYLRDEKTGLCYSIPCGVWSMGRKDDLEIALPVTTTDTYMSRHQADIIVRRNFMGEYCMYVKDRMRIPNSSRINGQKIIHSKEFQLYDGDVLRMGLTPFTVHLWPDGKEIFKNRKN